MADLEAMRDEFAAAFAAGDSPDPSEWLERVEGSERQELERLIDLYLMTAPRRAWDADAYERSLAKQAVDRVFESREGQSGTWPELLPRLRNRARIKRSELVRRLTEALGVGTGEAELEKVGGYYNGMEHGNLPASGVSGKVLTALAAIVDSTAEDIRAAGERVSETAGGKGIAFARKAELDPGYADAEVLADAPVPAAAAPASEPPARDLIDELFTGGP